MSKNLSDEAITSFDALVKEAYQGKELLGGIVRVKSNVVGTTHQFPKIGKGMAKKRVNPFSKLIPMNLAYTHTTATLEEYHATEWSSIWQEQEVPWEERSLLAGAIRGAIERRKDQLIIDAVNAAATPNLVSINIGGANSGLNVDKIRRAARLLDDFEVEMSDRFFVGQVRGKEDLLGVTQVTSADFNSVRALVNGEVDSLLGFKFRWIGTRGEGGLAIAANSRDNFAWHKQAVGLATSGLGEIIDIDWVPENKSYLHDQGFKAGAVQIDLDGLVEIATFE